MKKTIAFLVSLFSCVTIINAQEICSTPSPEPPQWIFNPSLKPIRANKLYRINIFVHIVQSSTGLRSSKTIAPLVVNYLNNSFANVRIQFVLQGVDLLDNNYKYLAGKERELFNTSRRKNAINIYVVPKSLWTKSGQADSIPSTALIIRSDRCETSDLPHEMGHCLGLYHTHHGTWNEPDSHDSTQCREFVDGSNSSTCGDYISDTPADPCLWSMTTCAYTGTGKDGHKQRYTPDASNYMSYANPLCRTKFTNGQIERMKRSIDTTAILQDVLFCKPPSRPTMIKGMAHNNQLAPNSQYGFWIDDVGNADSIEWTVWGGKIIGGQGTSHVSIETADYGAFRIQVSKRNNCGWSGSCIDHGTINLGLAPFSLSPNPATDAVTLKLTEGGDGILSPQGQGCLTTKCVTSTYEIQLWSGLTMLRSFKTNRLTFQIPIAGLPAGLYFVRGIKDGQTYTEKLIKN